MTTPSLDSSQWLAAPRTVCGIMSGTSLDGVDAAIARISVDAHGRHVLQSLGHATIPIPPEILEDLRACIADDQSITALAARINAGLPHLFADAVQSACAAADIVIADLDAAGVHGQTVWHAPQREDFGPYATGTTLQLGAPSALAQLIGIPVVGDFRTADVALGGQGAPLVSVFDREFLGDAREPVVALNIGGIANITLLPPLGSADPVLAFDTGPGNVLIDSAARLLFGKRQDTGGMLAKEGVVHKRLMDVLQQESFIAQAPPKSTGRELFNADYLQCAMQNTYFEWQPAEDILRTVTEFTAWSIAANLRQFGADARRIVAAGGGVHNPVLMQALRNALPTAEIVTSEDIGIPADAKEALCFAYLAWRTLAGLPGNIPSVTGAKREAILGAVALV